MLEIYHRTKLGMSHKQIVKFSNPGRHREISDPSNRPSGISITIIVLLKTRPSDYRQWKLLGPLLKTERQHSKKSGFL